MDAGGLQGSKSTPHSAVAFESGTKCNLQDGVAFLHSTFGLSVGQLVPRGAAGSVAESVQGHPRGLHVPFRQLQAVLHLVQNGSASRVDAKMVERKLEVGDVGFDVEEEELASHESGKEEDLF